MFNIMQMLQQFQQQPWSRPMQSPWQMQPQQQFQPQQLQQMNQPQPFNPGQFQRYGPAPHFNSPAAMMPTNPMPQPQPFQPGGFNRFGPAMQQPVQSGQSMQLPNQFRPMQNFGPMRF